MGAMSRKKSLETALVLTLAFLVLYFIKSNVLYFYLALTFGLIGLLIEPLAKVIAVAWFKFADILSFFVSKLVLGSVFFLILFPISFFYRLAKNDPLKMKSNVKSTWVNRNHIYQKEDLVNIW